VNLAKSCDAIATLSMAKQHLAGLLPSALLERYAFWQRDRDGNLVGYPLVDDPSRPLYRIEVIDDRTS
jgi:hypothetical protein